MRLLLSCALTVFNVVGKSWWLQSIELRLDHLDIFDRVQFIFLLKRARPNVRAKWDGVNSVFLVQLRKMMAGDFLGSERIKKSVEDVLPSRWQRGIRIC